MDHSFCSSKEEEKSFDTQRPLVEAHAKHTYKKTFFMPVSKRFSLGVIKNPFFLSRCVANLRKEKKPLQLCTFLLTELNLLLLLSSVCIFICEARRAQRKKWGNSSTKKDKKASTNL